VIDVTSTHEKKTTREARKIGIKLHNTNKVSKPFMQKKTRLKRMIESVFLSAKK
jgi:hypothetical protein